MEKLLSIIAPYFKTNSKINSFIIASLSNLGQYFSEKLWSTLLENRSEIPKVFKDKCSTEGKAKTYLELRKNFERGKQFEKAIECYINHLKFAKNLKDRKQEKNTYNGLAWACGLTNNSEVAKEYFNKVLEVELISFYHQNASKFQNDDVIEKLSTGDVNKGWSATLGKLK